MSQDNESPIGPMYDPESPQGRKRLGEIERKLKGARPRPVELDGFELERQAFATPVLRASKRSAPPRRRRRWAALAASWICGALVGAIGMFLTMRAPADSTTIASGERDHPVIASHESGKMSEAASDDPAVMKGNWSEWEANVLALASPGGESLVDRHRPRLRAGMCLPHTFQSEWEDPEPVEPGDDDGAVSITNEPLPYSAPEPPITREELMRELLGNSPDFVL